MKKSFENSLNFGQLKKLLKYITFFTLFIDVNGSQFKNLQNEMYVSKFQTDP
jgi:hypothetical protein